MVRAPVMLSSQAAGAGGLDAAGASLYSRATVVFVSAAVFFHSLGVFTESWCHLTWSGHRFTVGLWRGCLEKATKQWECSRKYSRTSVFDISWGVGAQVLITLALAILIVVDVVVLGYTCLPRLTQYRLRLIEALCGLCLLTALLTVVGLVVFACEVMKYPDVSNARIAWSFGMCVLSLLFVSASAALAFLDRKLEVTSLSYRRQSLCLQPISEQTRY